MDRPTPRYPGGLQFARECRCPFPWAQLVALEAWFHHHFRQATTPATAE